MSLGSVLKDVVNLSNQLHGSPSHHCKIWFLKEVEIEISPEGGEMIRPQIMKCPHIYRVLYLYAPPPFLEREFYVAAALVISSCFLWGEEGQ